MDGVVDQTGLSILLLIFVPSKCSIDGARDNDCEELAESLMLLAGEGRLYHSLYIHTPIGTTRVWIIVGAGWCLEYPIVFSSPSEYLAFVPFPILHLHTRFPSALSCPIFPTVPPFRQFPHIQI